MMVRTLRPLIAALASLVILSGCTAQAQEDPANGPATAGAAVALDPAVASLPGAITETTITASDDLREEPTTYLGAMHEATPSGGEAVIPTRENTAALITAFDADNNVLARAITIRLDGFTPTDVELDYTSTAFARLLTLPSFVTDNPLGVMILRGAAEQSPALPRLASAIEANAANNPAFETDPTPAENKALATLADDVRATLAEVARETAPREGAARSAPAWAMRTPIITADETDPPCLSTISPVGAIVAHTDEEPFCLRPSAGKKGEYALAGENSAALWAAVYTYDTSQPRPLRFAGVLNPYKFTLPDLNTIISAITTATVKNVVATGVSIVCQGGSLIGLDCPEEWVEEFDPSKFFEDILDAIDVNQDGKATITLSAGEAANAIAILTPGLGTQDGHFPAEFVGVDTPIRQGALTIASVYSTILEPLLGLFLGSPIEDLRNQHRGDGKANINQCTLNPKHRDEPPACGADANTLVALALTIEKSENLGPAITHAANAISGGDLNDILPSLADLAIKVAFDKAVMETLIGDVAEGVAANALQAALIKFGASAVPGLNVLTAANDIGIPILNAFIGSWNFGRAMGGTQRITIADAPNPDLTKTLTGYDFAGAAYTYESYFSDGVGEGFLPFHLLPDGRTDPPMPGARDVRLLGQTYGTIDGAPVALVAVQIWPDEALGRETLTVAVHLIGLDPITRTPYTKAILMDFPGYRYARTATYAIEDDRVVAYYGYFPDFPGSEGAAQQDDRVTFTMGELGVTATTENVLVEDVTTSVPVGTTNADGITYVFSKDVP